MIDYSEVVNFIRGFYRTPDSHAHAPGQCAKAMLAMRLAVALMRRLALIEFVIAGPQQLNNDKFVMRPFSLWGHFRCAPKMVRPATEARLVPEAPAPGTE